ncbi:MAG TPA: thiopurine S-methyltransferase [Steroidobacteraceae bacterium]
MQPEFWQERWRISQIGFHQSSVDRNLQACWPILDMAANSDVFVPLCGKSLDLKWLREQGCKVTGVEVSDIAVEAFFMENGIPARRRPLNGFDLYEAERLRLFRGDFFSLTRELLGNISVIYDRAALISWEPGTRARYVERMTALTLPGVHTLLIVVDFPQAQMQGPPFSVTEDDVDRLYGREHSIEKLLQRDILEIEPRLRARGLTELREVCYRLTRK